MLAAWITDDPSVHIFETMEYERSDSILTHPQRMSLVRLYIFTHADTLII